MLLLQHAASRQQQQSEVTLEKNLIEKATFYDQVIRKVVPSLPGWFLLQGTVQSLSVYVGDSMSDLAPLLAADVGIVVGQNKLLRRVATAAGITLRPLVAGLP